MVAITVPADRSARIALSATAVASLALAYHLLTRPPRLPKGAHAPRRAPTSHWLLGDLPALLRNATRYNDWMLETTRACDEQPWLHSAPVLPDMVIVATPAIVEDITRTQHDVFGKGDFTRDTLYELLGDSFFSLDGPAWLHQRKIASKFFSAKMYREIATPITHAHIARLVEQLAQAQNAGTTVNVSSLLSGFAFQNFAELGFGLDSEQDDSAALEQALDNAFVFVFGRMQKPVWLWKLQKKLNVGDERKYHELTTFLRSFVSDLVSKSLAVMAAKGSDQRGDDIKATTMVELFIHAMHDGDSEISPDLLCDLALFFVLAGRDTTAATLEWFFYSLYKHPEIEHKIRDELWKQVPALMDGKVSAISVEETHKLTYLEAAIKETMRLYPAATLGPRQALSDTILVDGTFIPKGMSIGIATYAMGRLTSVWGTDAARFKPDRFLDPTTGKLAAVPPFKFYGFGAGPRNCLGMNLAMLEMKMLISTLLSRFRLDMAPNDGHYKFSATLTLDKPLIATIHEAPTLV